MATYRADLTLTKLVDDAPVLNASQRDIDLPTHVEFDGGFDFLEICFLIAFCSALLAIFVLESRHSCINLPNTPAHRELGLRLRAGAKVSNTFAPDVHPVERKLTSVVYDNDDDEDGDCGGGKY
jgi:hypothetical protein